jgi:hypothetical protein
MSPQDLGISGGLPQTNNSYFPEYQQLAQHEGTP